MVVIVEVWVVGEVDLVDVRVLDIVVVEVVVRVEVTEENTRTNL